MYYLLKQKVVDNLLVIMLIFSTGGLLFVFHRNTMYYIFIILILFSFLFSGQAVKRSIFNRSIFSLSSVFCLLGITYIFADSQQSFLKYGFYIMVILVSTLTLTHFLNNREPGCLVERLYFILKLILFHSICNFLFYFVVKDGLSIISTPWSGTEYATFNNLFFYSTKELATINIFGFDMPRNHGLFWEPGILQAYLNMFFFLEGFVFKRNKALLLITGLTIVTTYSTTGLVILLVLGIYYLKENITYNKLIIPILIGLLVPLYMIFSFNVEEKVIGERESSFQKRLFDLTQPMFIALRNPFTGIGLDKDEFQKMRQEFYMGSSFYTVFQDNFGIEAKVEDSEKGCSNSITFLFAATGFPIAILLIWLFFKQQIITIRPGIWMMILVITVLSEPLLLRPFFFIFIMSGLLNMYNRIVLN